MLEIFILYSVSTSHFDRINFVPTLSIDVESLSVIRLYKSHLPPAVDHPMSVRHCVRASAYVDLLSHVEQYRVGIVETNINLCEELLVKTPLFLYNDSIPRHWQNAETFVE